MIFAAAVVSVDAFAIDGGAYGAFSPYSVFGYGNMVTPGTPYNTGMGGVGIASRNNRFLNILNPAAVTARDSLAFMLDFSVGGAATIYRQDTRKSANNTFNITGLAFSFPLWKNAAMMVGITPFSYQGYNYSFIETDPRVIAALGTVNSNYSGQGGMYQVFAGIGHTFFKRLSVGVQGNLLFGNLERTDIIDYGDESVPDLSRVTEATLSGFNAKLGLQYEQPIGSQIKIGVGATYRFQTNQRGWLESTLTSTQIDYTIDTLANTPDRLKIASEIGVGISFTYGDKIRAEFDYTRSDWNRTALDRDPFFCIDDSKTPFTTNVSQAFRAGIEYIPNRSDIRYYFKKVAYRAGVYHCIDYFRIAGQDVTSTGITLGATFPVFRWYNGLTVGLDFGKRSSKVPDSVREYYFKFSFAMNLFDIWFQKPKYE